MNERLCKKAVIIGDTFFFKLVMTQFDCKQIEKLRPVISTQSYFELRMLESLEKTEQRT